MIRPATAADLPAIHRIVTDAYALYVPRMGRAPAPVEADHAALVAAGEVWLAVVGGEPRGVLVIRGLPGGELLLESVAVDPAFQGRGLGRGLIGFAEDEARRRGSGQVVLYTNAAMTENLSLYPALGYEQSGRRVEDGFDRVYFTKRLA